VTNLNSTPISLNLGASNDFFRSREFIVTSSLSHQFTGHIGFNNDEPASRRSSLLALAVTESGGFLLMAGLGTNEYPQWDVLHAGTGRQQCHAEKPRLLRVNSFLVCAGAFTKSAQFPFHFWLRGAMKAPTPVGAHIIGLAAYFIGTPLWKKSVVDDLKG
jgi:formate hydrogenlyase subunit 3/multisubunit Na+/H+ antiporter MnhD subunit